MNAKLITANQNVNPFQDRLTLAHNALALMMGPTTTYFVEDVELDGDGVRVTYINEADLNAGRTDDDNWNVGYIRTKKLELFTTNNFGLSTGYADISLAMYLDENMRDVVKAYLDAGREVMLCL